MDEARGGRELRGRVRGGLLITVAAVILGCSSQSGEPSGSGSSGGTSSSGGSGGSSGSASSGGQQPDGGMMGGSFGSVCGYKDAVSLGAPGMDGMVDVPPAHPDILYFGRIDCSNPMAPSFAFPAVSIRMKFQGDAVDMRLKDHGTGTVKSTNYYDVILDGAAPTVLEVSPAQEVYSLGKNLGQGPHTVEVWKRIESAPGGTPNAGKGELLGFRVPKDATILPLAPRAHRIEFIGDSITCGYGDEVSVADPSMSPYTTKESNADLAWGAVTARALDAELMSVAYSGRGVYRNFMNGGGDTLPQMYLKTLPDDGASTPWKTASWTPDVIVINLGTNDFSTVGTDDAAYRTAYTDFLKALRGYYPSAEFVLAVGPMISDYYPAGEMAWTKIQADIMQVAAARMADGDKAIHTLIIPPQSAPYGEDYHPTVATHQSMANAAIALIKQIKSW